MLLGVQSLKLAHCPEPAKAEPGPPDGRGVNLPTHIAREVQNFVMGHCFQGPELFSRGDSHIQRPGDTYIAFPSVSGLGGSLRELRGVQKRGWNIIQR